MSSTIKAADQFDEIKARMEAIAAAREPEAAPAPKTVPPGTAIVVAAVGAGSEGSGGAEVFEKDIRSVRVGLSVFDPPVLLVGDEYYGRVRDRIGVPVSVYADEAEVKPFEWCPPELRRHCATCVEQMNQLGWQPPAPAPRPYPGSSPALKRPRPDWAFCVPAAQVDSVLSRDGELCLYLNGAPATKAEVLVWLASRMEELCGISKAIAEA